MEREIFNTRYFLTDGGMETTLIYHHGLNLPHFATFELVTNEDGRMAIKSYFKPYLEIAAKYNLGFIMETPTWRANTDWGFKMGYSQKELDEINRLAVHFLHEVIRDSGMNKEDVIISGNIGPRGDGYIARKKMDIDEAQFYHFPQINTFAWEGVDVVTAMTLNYVEEAIGIIHAARDVNVPVVISFTVETDGKLPGGESLSEAIEMADELTGGYPLHYMINCAHPEHFKGELSGGNWLGRIKGVRANASVKSHDELDASDTLDAGDKCQLAKNYVELMKLLPGLKIIGGCCGTDHSHLEEIVRHLFLRTA